MSSLLRFSLLNTFFAVSLNLFSVFSIVSLFASSSFTAMNTGVLPCLEVHSADLLTLMISSGEIAPLN